MSTTYLIKYYEAPPVQQAPMKSRAYFLAELEFCQYFLSKSAFHFNHSLLRSTREFSALLSKDFLRNLRSQFALMNLVSESALSSAISARPSVLLLTENGEIPELHCTRLDADHNALLNAMLRTTRTKLGIAKMLSMKIAQDVHYTESEACLNLRKELKPLYFLYVWEGNLPKARKFVKHSGEDINTIDDSETRRRVSELMKTESSKKELATGTYAFMQSCHRAFCKVWNQYITDAKLLLQSQKEPDEVKMHLFIENGTSLP